MAVIDTSAGASWRRVNVRIGPTCALLGVTEGCARHEGKQCRNGTTLAVRQLHRPRSGGRRQDEYLITQRRYRLRARDLVAKVRSTRDIIRNHQRRLDLGAGLW